MTVHLCLLLVLTKRRQMTSRCPVSAVKHCAPVIVVAVKRSLCNLCLPFFSCCRLHHPFPGLLLEYRQICKVVMQKRLRKRGSVYTLLCVAATFCSESDPVKSPTNFFPIYPRLWVYKSTLSHPIHQPLAFLICSTSSLYLFIVFGFLQFSLNQFGPFAAGTQIDVPEKYLVLRT